MALEYAIRCDGCGRLIASSRSSAGAARAEAQLERGAVSSGGKDWCKSCRVARQAELARRRPAALGPSIGTRAPR